MVFRISAAVLTTSSCFVSSLVNSFIVFFMPPPKAPIITDRITVYADLLSIISKPSCQYRVNLSLRYVSILFYMLQIQIFFSYFVSSTKSGLLAVSVFRRLNWKPQTCFTLSFSKTISPIVLCTTPCQLQSTCVLSSK